MTKRTTTWDHRKYGSSNDPIRPRDLDALVSPFQCARRFAYEKGDVGRTSDGPVRLRASIRDAVRVVVTRYLRESGARILAGSLPCEDAVRAVLELATARAIGSRELDWRSPDPAREQQDAIAMILGALQLVSELASQLVLIGAPYEVELPGRRSKTRYVVAGTLDLAYVPRSTPEGLGLLSWDLGEERPDGVTLDHGPLLDLPARALERGTFRTGEDTEVRVDAYPTEIGVAHLRDAVPYRRSGTRTIVHEEEARHHGRAIGARIRFEAGEMRGPILYRSNRRHDDLVRLGTSLDSIVGTVRLGRFTERLSDACGRCPFVERCLGSDRGEAARRGAALPIVA